MGVPVLYRKAGEGSLATYSFAQISTGRGILPCYLADKISGTTRTYLMWDEAFYAWSGELSGDDNAAVDIDFDIPFDRKIVVEGKAVLNVSMGFTSVSSTETHNRTFTFYIRKWDGTTETEIVSDTFTMNASVGIGAWAKKSVVLLMDIPETIFNEGDSLRVSIVSAAPGGGNADRRQFYIWFDPKNRTINTSAAPTFTNSTLYTPIRVFL